MTQTSTIIAGIDVHKRMLMVAVGRCHTSESEQEQTRQVEFESRRFGTTQSELQHLSTWLETRGVGVVVMESTAQYWVPVWSVLEPFFELKLAQAWSNRAPRGKKTDFKDAQRLVRRYLADELTLSFVPNSEQREMRTLTRRHKQLAAQRIRIQNQVEALLEQGRIKLSSVISDLFGSSGRRILSALSQGKTDPAELADLGNARLKCGREVLKDALNGKLTSLQQKLLQQYLKEVELIEEQIKDLAQWTAAAMQPYEEVVVRLTAIPGVQVTAAHQIIAEVGATAAAFASSSRFSSWVGACPGRKESAGENQSSRCARGNRYLRATLCQVAQAAVRTKNCWIQEKFKRLVARLGYVKAIWAIVHLLCKIVWNMLHKGQAYLEKGKPTTPQAAKRRAQKIARELRILGYTVNINPATDAALPL